MYPSVWFTEPPRQRVDVLGKDLLFMVRQTNGKGKSEQPLADANSHPYLSLQGCHCRSRVRMEVTEDGTKVQCGSEWGATWGICRYQ